jgi:transposase-like protein
VLCVRWYLRFGLSFRNLEEIMAERNLSVDHVRLSPQSRRDAAAAKRFFQKALRAPGHPRPRVINVDGNPSYPKVITELKQTGELGRRCRCRPVRYLNNIIEQDHRAVKRRVRASQGFRSFHCAWRTLQGIETMNMIRKGQVRWLRTASPGRPRSLDASSASQPRDRGDHPRLTSVSFHGCNTTIQRDVSASTIRRFAGAGWR